MKKCLKLLKIYSAPNLPPIPNIILLPHTKKVSVYRTFLGSLTFYFHYFTIDLNKMFLSLKIKRETTIQRRFIFLCNAPALLTFSKAQKKTGKPVFLYSRKESNYLEYSSTMLVSLTSSLYGSSSLCGKRTRVAVQLSKDFSMYGRSKVLASWKDCLNISLDL